jgi:hypothetical protein
MEIARLVRRTGGMKGVGAPLGGMGRRSFEGFGDLNTLERQVFEYQNGIWAVTSQGVPMIEGLMAPFSTTPTAFASPSANGDIVIVWYAGYLIPPPGSEPGPYNTLNELLMKHDKPGRVHLIETDIIHPFPKKRSVILTDNAATVAELASTSSSTTLPAFAVGQGANPNVIAAARMMGPPRTALAGMWGVGAVVVGGVVLLSLLGGRKSRRS